MFSKIQNFCRKPALILPLLGIFTFVSCRKEKLVANIAEQAVSKSSIANNVKRLSGFSGEEIFTGLFFLQGDAAHALPSFKDFATQIDTYLSKNTSSANEIDKIKTNVLASITKSDANYFQNLKKVIESDNLYAIEDALSEAASRFRRAVMLDETYGSVFQTGDSLIKDTASIRVIEKLDLSTESDRAKFSQIISNHSQVDSEGRPIVGGGGTGSAILPIFLYVLVVLVTIAAIFFTYFVVLNMAVFITIIFVYKLKFVGAAKEGLTPTTKELLVAEIADTF